MATVITSIELYIEAKWKCRKFVTFEVALLAAEATRRLNILSFLETFSEKVFFYFVYKNYVKNDVTKYAPSFQKC